MQNRKCKKDVILARNLRRTFHNMEFKTRFCEIVTDLSYWVFTINGAGDKIKTTGGKGDLCTKKVYKNLFPPIQML